MTFRREKLAHRVMLFLNARKSLDVRRCKLPQIRSQEKERPQLSNVIIEAIFNLRSNAFQDVDHADNRNFLIRALDEYRDRLPPNRDF